MKAFELYNPSSVAAASAALAKAGGNGRALAGGIDLLGEMKEYISQPDVVVNLKSVKNLGGIKQTRSGISIGALATVSQVANHALIRASYAALAEAAESVGSPQIRNVGTIGGNLCQRPRCWYYRDEMVVCLKKGGDRCYAIDGENEYHAILGGGPSWIVHPSDCAPALIALGASVEIVGANGKTRRMPLEKFFVLPTENVMTENVLEAGDIVTRIDVPKPAAGTKSHYLKLKHRESFDWALSGAAVALTMNGKTVKEARVILSGVAPVPWRAKEAEAVLKGKVLTSVLADRAGAAAVAKAKPLGGNAYKVPLTRNIVRLAILEAAGMSG
jgi:xanthine dehydrogenase YagS FAD-binding subunit